MYGVDPQVIGPVIIAPWVEHVAEWVERDIDPERIDDAIKVVVKVHQ